MVFLATLPSSGVEWRKPGRDVIVNGWIRPRWRVGLCAVMIASIPSPGPDHTAPPGQERRRDAAQYVWEQLTERAAFPPSYNFPVQLAPDGRFVALHAEGTWVSRDGVRWTPGPLPWSGMNAAYLSYIQYGGGTWALGVLDGNYQRFTIDPLIRRTLDFATWEVVGRSGTLPQVVFYAAASFRGAMWILGGYDGAHERAAVWRSTDGLTWRRAVSRAPWRARAGAKAVVYRDRLFLVGGGVLDGPTYNDVWSSPDGIRWRRETAVIAPEEPVGYAPIVFQDRLWLIGANRSGHFTSGVLVSDDGKSWEAQMAPWSPRGGVAVWTDAKALYLAGGKYSTVEQGQTVFTYRNDVWRMRQTKAPDAPPMEEP